MRIRDALFGWKIEKGRKTARRTGPFGCTWFRMVVYFWLNLNLSRSAKICLENKIRIWNHQGCAAAAAPCPRPPAFIFGWQLKIYLVVRPGDLLFEISLWDKNSLTVICLFVFDFLCCIEVCNLKWLNWECLNSSVRSAQHWSSKGSVRRLTLAFSDTDSSFLVYFV